MDRPKTFFSAEDFAFLRAVERTMSEMLDEMAFFDPTKDALSSFQRGQLEELVKVSQGDLHELILFLTMNPHLVETPVVEDIPVSSHA